MKKGERPGVPLAAHLGDYLEGVTLVVVEGYEIDLGLVAAWDHAAIVEELVEPERRGIGHEHQSAYLK